MRPVSRRTALTMGGVGLAGTLVGGTGLWRELSAPDADGAFGGRGDEGGDDELVEPEVLSSSDGRLEVQLQARFGTHEVAGRSARTMGYNGGVPGPTLRLRPGDLLRIALENQLDHVTNLHVHGLHVTPEGNGDNVFLEIGPGESRQYEYRLPEDHPPGVYWYHPHHHGTVADQLFAGLYGAIVVEEDDPPALDRERVLVVSDITLTGDGSVEAPSMPERMMGREGELVLVDGQVEPLLRGRAGERERWRVVNACSSRYLSLRLAGEGTDVQVLGRDVGRLARPVDLDQVVLAPGNRLDLLVDLAEGGSELVAVPVDRGQMMGGMMGDDVGPEDAERVLARLEVGRGGGSSAGGSGDGTAGGAPGPDGPLADLREARVDRRRELTMEMSMGGMMGGGGGGKMMDFTIDGRSFDVDRVDQQVRLGTVEEWTIGNVGPLDHPFHLHVWPMQVMDVDGRRPQDPLWLDVVNVPAEGSVTVRIRFADFGGRTVYHCHILDHEDLGMMGTILVE
ncbi:MULTISPECIES: multicopper oxidase family protein [Ornithinimicrobium]|uniref:multicopper oxidase family protein n=1 Tax=Ornithinimicrobium TaxID=125287 RepID=UPI00107066C2|nr:multicopper oxidase family protein [Ornithinimicrobium flavum]